MRRGVQSSFWVTPMIVLATACGTDAPTLAPFGDFDLTGTWRFSWTLEDSCQIEIDFDVVQARYGYFQGSETGTPPSFCLQEWPVEFRRGSLVGQVSDDGTLWLHSRWKDEEIWLEASARLGATPAEMVEGLGRWDYWGTSEWWEDAWSLSGVFTANRLTPP
jgi:hypothetical protein